MTIQTAINLLFSNVGISLGDWGLLMAVAVSVLFMMANFRLGLIMLLIFDTLLFIVYTLLGIPNYNAIILLLLTGTILSASLYFRSEGEYVR